MAQYVVNKVTLFALGASYCNRLFVPLRPLDSEEIQHSHNFFHFEYNDQRDQFNVYLTDPQYPDESIEIRISVPHPLPGGVLNWSFTWKAPWRSACERQRISMVYNNARGDDYIIYLFRGLPVVLTGMHPLSLRIKVFSATNEIFLTTSSHMHVLCAFNRPIEYFRINCGI